MASVGDARCRHLSSTSSPLPEDSFALHKHNMHDLPAVAKPMLAKPAWPKHLVPFINTDADGSPRSFLLVSTELGTQATWIARLNPFPPSARPILGLACANLAPPVPNDDRFPRPKKSQVQGYGTRIIPSRPLSLRRNRAPKLKLPRSSYGTSRPVAFCSHFETRLAVSVNLYCRRMLLIRQEEMQATDGVLRIRLRFQATETPVRNWRKVWIGK